MADQRIVGPDGKSIWQVDSAGRAPVKLFGADLLGNPVEISVAIDPQGKAVLRVVDAAPWAYDAATDRLRALTGEPAFVSLNAAMADGPGTAKNFGRALANLSMQVVLTGGPTGGQVKLEGSLNGTDWFDLGATFTIGTDTSGTIKFSTGKPVQWARANLSGLTGGTNPTVTALIAAT